MNNEMINVKECIDTMETMINGGKKESSAVDKLKAAEYGGAFWNHMHQLWCKSRPYLNRRDKETVGLYKRGTNAQRF